MIASEKAPTGPELGSHGHVVVVVDDEPEVLAALRRVFRRQEFELRTTERPEQALAWAEDGELSLVICDQQMPSMLGTEVLEQVARVAPQTQGVILTGYPGSAAALHPAVRKLLYKPWNDETLRRTVASLLRERDTERRTVAGP